MPGWLKKLYPNSFDKDKTIKLCEHSPVIENFLIDAESFWKSETSEKLWSGQWIEKNPAGEECFMEATALCTNGAKILLIELSRYTYTEKQSIIQKGRELDLDYRRLDKMVAAIKESESRFRVLFENSPDAIFVEDFKGIVLDANPAACVLHGYENSELIGKNVLDLVPPVDRKKESTNFKKNRHNKWKQRESVRLKSDGRSIPVEINGAQIQYDSKPALLLHVRDITERKDTEQELKKHRDHLKELVDV